MKALTAEAWKHWESGDAMRVAASDGATVLVAEFSGGSDTLHATAALALHGQSFGFTWADVDRLHMAAEIARRFTGNAKSDGAVAVDDIADRIAALLPPREP